MGRCRCIGAIGSYGSRCMSELVVCGALTSTAACPRVPVRPCVCVGLCFLCVCWSVLFVCVLVCAFLLHRCIIVAKSDLAHWRLAEALAQHRVDKRYVALVHGDVAREQVLCPVCSGLSCGCRFIPSFPRIRLDSLLHSSFESPCCVC